MLALIFLRFSFLSEFITYYTGKHTYVLYLFGLPALVALLYTGGLRRSFRETGPKLWLAFLIWMCLGVPFSIWKGGSFQLAVNYAETEFFLLLLMVGLTTGWAECRKIMYAIAAATAFNVIIAFHFMTPGQERLSFKWSGMIGNSNDFGAHLLLVLPFFLFVILKPNTRRLVRLLFASLMVLGLFEIMRTASRGALIALIVTVAFLLLHGSMRQRIAIGTTTVIVLVVLIALLPKDTWNRMLSLSADDAGASTEALDSSYIRKHLLEESIKCTLKYPLLGVGLGQFPQYEGAGRVSQPGHFGWLETHNAYTQISSECGIPALLLYLAALVWSFRLLWRIKKMASGSDAGEMVTVTYVVSIGLVAYSMAISFVNFGFAFQFLLVSGLIETMWRTVRTHPDEKCALPRKRESNRVPRIGKRSSMGVESSSSVGLNRASETRNTFGPMMILMGNKLP